LDVTGDLFYMSLVMSLFSICLCFLQDMVSNSLLSVLCSVLSICLELILFMDELFILLPAWLVRISDISNINLLFIFLIHLYWSRLFLNQIISLDGWNEEYLRFLYYGLICVFWVVIFGHVIKEQTDHTILPIMNSRWIARVKKWYPVKKEEVIVCWMPSFLFR